MDALTGVAIFAIFALTLWIVRRRFKASNPRRARLSRTVLSQPAAKLSPPNIPSDWKTAGAWRYWEAPLDVVEAESLAEERLAQIAGVPRPRGHLIAVAATLRREFSKGNGTSSIRVEVEGSAVGYISGELSRDMAMALDEAGFSSCTVAGVIRGGAADNPTLHLYLWLGRRASRGPMLMGGDLTAYEAPWPPAEHEGR
jgi:hypothetical protein